ncbi:DUF6768 family protein [Brevundimonas sp.]|uniref:DUF6768 family protein n=1 Tax=Brevundimonas sp. TaxID=1871086 RepID=UPI001AD51FE4|nr:DUF6768 family protein [Brevundimonas sp.]MBN9466299.1 hypothetical protein [Brevundimonas sp.]
MKEIDDTLEEAVRAEERELLRRIGSEPGHVEQLLAVFRARNGWVSIVLMVTQFVFFAGGAWAGWRFFQATETLTALRFGLPSAVLLTMALMMKLAVWPNLNSERQLQILARIELLLSKERTR